MLRTGFVFVAALFVAQNAEETAFKKFVDHSAGGVWIGIDSKGNKQEARWEWILDKKFARFIYKDKDNSSEEIHGIDPATGKWTYHGYDSAGRTFKGIGTETKPNDFLFIDAGQGPKGAVKSRGVLSIIGANAAKWDQQEYIVDGEKQPSGVVNWTRKK